MPLRLLNEGNPEARLAKRTVRDKARRAAQTARADPEILFWGSTYSFVYGVRDISTFSTQRVRS